MKEKIVQQSILLFEKYGFSQTSIQDIVDALSVTKGTFYYYFNSKEELLMKIHLQYIEQLLKKQEKIMENPSLTHKEKISGIVELLITDIGEKGPSARVFFREIRHLKGENSSEIKEMRKQFRLKIEEIVRLGVEAGEFRDGLQIEMTAFGILGVTNWSYQWYDPSKQISDKQLADIFVDMILHGIEKKV
ncbi:TetR/AcrR family transcriptional regulator [Heyndrickxia acidicola]|uniref:TetR/AcrR family transcriptional regulator n=1 Tax=Heyndrickxia acidicola TaxID=209389 RepID=A0ABU6MLY2_9BACI|nr:TetR/AcrR family transcriptional regulator [Heyndrickxia acidicola]MED1204060.1 TetR/AcrR family transcriptional regulator [Heyndrickxia acidicola]